MSRTSYFVAAALPTLEVISLFSVATSIGEGGSSNTGCAGPFSTVTSAHAHGNRPAPVSVVCATMSANALSSFEFSPRIGAQRTLSKFLAEIAKLYPAQGADSDIRARSNPALTKDAPDSIVGL